MNLIVHPDDHMFQPLIVGRSEVDLCQWLLAGVTVIHNALMHNLQATRLVTLVSKVRRDGFNGEISEWRGVSFAPNECSDF